MITKGRLHMTFAILVFASVIEVGVCFLFLRKDLSRKHVCMTVNIINHAGVYALLILNCGILASGTTLNYLWIIMQLMKKKKKKRHIFNKRTTNADSQLNRPILISLGIYVSFVPTRHIHWLLPVFH